MSEEEKQRAAKHIVEGARSLDDARVCLQRAAAVARGTSIADVLEQLIANVSATRDRIDTEAA